MSVRKFRSVEAIPTPWFLPGDPALWRAIAAIWDFGQRTIHPRFPPGVYRHRSIEELGRLEAAWAAANFRSFREWREAGQAGRANRPPEPMP